MKILSPRNIPNIRQVIGTSLHQYYFLPDQHLFENYVSTVQPPDMVFIDLVMELYKEISKEIANAQA